MRAILLVLLVAVRAAGVEWVVAPDGDDGAAGDATAPFRTLARATRALRGGDTLLLRAGVYREQLTLDARHSGTAAAPTVLAAWPGQRAVITAWEAATGWEAAGDGRWRCRWAVDSQQAFADGVELARIGPLPPPLRGEAADGSWRLRARGEDERDLVPGSFCVRDGWLWLRLADDGDPRARRIEAAVRSRTILAVDAEHVVLRDLACRGGNLTATLEQGSTVEVGSFARIERCDIRHGDFGGVHLGWRRQGAQLVDSTVAENGACGVNAPEHRDLRIRGCLITGNNTRSFNPAWHAGGIKLVPRADGMVEGNRVEGNRGSGIWTDSCRSGRPLAIVANTVVGNGDGSRAMQAGIHVEISADVVVANNLVRDTRGRGIFICASDRVLVAHNTVTGTDGPAAVHVGGLPRRGATLTEVRVLANLIAGNRAEADLALPRTDGEAVRAIVSDGNQFWRGDGPPRLALQHRACPLTAWRDAGFDLATVVADPALDGAGRATAPATAAALPEVAVDRSGRPRGVRAAIGCSEPADAAGAAPAVPTLRPR